ncbi:MAG: hypothetical protein KDE25_10245 [Novosphingobium sp.]|nr:hypothetical protein [Novosphingobium sp.]
MSIDVPYQFAGYGFTVIGVVHVADNIENSSTEGVFAGAVIGTYNIDRNSGAVDIYDPTGNVLKVPIFMNFNDRKIELRIDNRNIDGSWNEGDWFVIASW